MQRAIIYVFSGTKNTLLTAKMVGGAFENLRISTTIYEVAQLFHLWSTCEG